LMPISVNLYSAINAFASASGSGDMNNPVV
jgi:hypothetical protein